MERIKCAIYSRFSTELQRETSIEDQERLCREFAGQKGWEIVEEFVISDRAISAQSLAPREGINLILEASKRKTPPFQCLLVYDTSRLARNIREALQIYEHLKFHNVFIFSVAQNIDGRSDSASMLVAVNGIVDAQYIKNLSKSVHRGLEGRFLKGYSTGSRRFGYRTKPVYSSHLDRYGNQAIDGYKLEINPEEAEIVREIFYLYGVKHVSAKTIAKMLNKRLAESGFPKPAKMKYWHYTAIAGQGYRQVGILNNEYLIGRVIWNRTRQTKNPITGRQNITVKPKSEWMIREAPELRIVSDELWNKVKERQDYIHKMYKGLLKSPKRAYSGALLTLVGKCNQCGANYVLVSGGKYQFYGCSRNWEYGLVACTNKVRINKQIIEDKICEFILDEIVGRQAYKPMEIEISASVAAFFKEKIGEVSVLNLDACIAEHKARIQRLVEAVAADGISISLRNALSQEEQKLEELEQYLNFANLNSSEDVEQVAKKVSMEGYFLDIAKKLRNSESRNEGFFSLVKEVTVDCSMIDCAKIQLIENSEKMLRTYIDSLHKHDSRIRLQSGTRSIPYTSHEWKLILTTDPSITTEQAGCSVYYVEKGINDRRSKRNEL